MPSVADLVEPLVTVADAIPDEVRAEATALLEADAVALDHFGPLSVTAQVTDAEGAHAVVLGATGQGLAATCDCPRGSTGLLCPHSLATAIETWHMAPKRRR